MAASKSKQSGVEERSVVELLGQLKTGQIAKDAIDTDTRRQCVLYMLSEGVSAAEMAQVTGVSDRTIRRDLEHVRQENGLTVDPATQQGLVGDLVLQARISMERIRRVTREKDAPHAVRIDGERAVFQIQNELTQRLQSLGYMPTATQRVQAELTHHFGDIQDLETLELETERLARLQGLDPAAADKLARMSRVTDQARLLESASSQGTSAEASPQPHESDPASASKEDDEHAPAHQSD